jgi:Cof subfamily protein (haloacid dehalogenase superfamily)
VDGDAPVSLPRLVATDLDGTLVRSDGTVSAYTHDVIAALDEAGVPVVFVTGRPLRWAEDVFEYVGAHGLAIVSNGALVWDVARDSVDLTRPIPVDVGLEACHRIREAVPGSAFAVETVAGIALERDFLERHQVPDGSRRGPLEEVFDEPALKLLARHEEIEAQEFWDRAEAAVDGAVTITWSSTSALLEISGSGVTKATTLALLCERLGVDRRDVIAFGDMPNDIPMLEWAGTSYAMADAHPTVRAVTPHTAPGHDEDGVASVLAGVFGL